MIRENVQKLLQELPAEVQLEAAAKTKNAAEILEAIAAGVKIIGENYVQEAENVFKIIGRKAKWHFIGHLQKNKVSKAVKIFDLIETVDSLRIGAEIDKICAQGHKRMPVLIEINSAQEREKFGVMPEEAEQLIKQLSQLQHIKVMGLMTMGPRSGDPEHARPYFAQTKKIFEQIADLGISGVEMRYLSMGMTNSYQAAIKEGANIVRIGSKIFGERT